jgi:hypothetical protein
MHVGNIDKFGKTAAATVAGERCNVGYNYT